MSASCFHIFRNSANTLVTCFMVHQLFPEALARSQSVLYVSNRVAVNVQQKQAVAKAVGAQDLFQMLTFQGWQMQE